MAPATAQRVREAVASTGYVPNLLAGGLASHKSRLITAVIPTTVNPVFSEMIDALRAHLLQAGYHLMLGVTGYDDANEDELVNLVVSRRPDGIVLTGVVHSETLRRRLAGARIPVVETWDLTPQPIDMLVPDRFRGQHPRHRSGFMARPEARAMGAGRDLYGLRRDGTQFPVEIGLRPIEKCRCGNFKCRASRSTPRRRATSVRSSSLNIET